MGARSHPIAQPVTELGKPPGKGEFEFTLLGPGYGESILLHVGEGVWILIDSCVGKDGTPRALQYLESIGVDPAEAVGLIVATHWHDDHIRGIANIVEVCSRAAFCCASVLCNKEFLAVADALERKRRRSFTSSGLTSRELEPPHAKAKGSESQRRSPTLQGVSGGCRCA